MKSARPVETTDKNNNQKLSNEYKIVGLLGRGGFGVVYKGQRKADGLKVAIKEVAKEKAPVTEDNVPREAVLLRLLVDVPGVIKILNHMETKKSYHIIMECFGCMDLYDFISEKGTLAEDLARGIFRQLLETVIECHKRGVFHSDIKDENILIDKDSGRIRLIDFGSGKFLHDGIFFEFEGTRIYSPPEWISSRFI